MTTIRRFARLPILLSTLAATAVAGAATADLGHRIDASLRRGGLAGAKVGILVADQETGEVLYARNPDLALVPASLTKLFTAAAALDTLQPEYRFLSTIDGVGHLEGSTWKGDLFLRSSGDPLLVEERLWLLVDGLRERGIRTVTGGLRVDDTFFDRERYGADWGPRSRSWYHAPHGAVSANFNTRKVGSRYLAIDDDPGVHAGRLLLALLKREGIEVRGSLEAGVATPQQATRLAETESRSLGSLVADLNKVSNNFIAEQLLKTMGAEVVGPPGTAAKGLEVVRSYLQRLGVPAGTYELHDGSGLSPTNRVSARTVVRLLDAAVRDFRIGPELLASLKVAGADGASRRFQDRSCRRQMRVKTGHLQAVAALAGFAETASGRRLVFAVIANGYRRGRHAADRGIERVCEAFLDDGAGAAAPVVRDLLAPSAEELAAGGGDDDVDEADGPASGDAPPDDDADEGVGDLGSPPER